MVPNASRRCSAYTVPRRHRRVNLRLPSSAPDRHDMTELARIGLIARKVEVFMFRSRDAIRECLAQVEAPWLAPTVRFNHGIMAYMFCCFGARGVAGHRCGTGRIDVGRFTFAFATLGALASRLHLGTSASPPQVVARGDC